MIMGFPVLSTTKAPTRFGEVTTESFRRYDSFMVYSQKLQTQMSD